MPTGTGCKKCNHLHDNNSSTRCTCDCHKTRQEFAKERIVKDDTGER